MNLAEMKVGTRLGFGFALVLFFLLVVTVLGISRMATIEDRLEHVVNVSNVETRLLISMRGIVQERIGTLRLLSLLTDVSDMEPEVAAIKEQTRKYTEAESQLAAKLAKDPNASKEDRELLARIKEYEVAALPLIGKATDLWASNQPEKATRVLVKEIRPVQKKWIDTLDEFITKKDRVNQAAAVEAQKSFVVARNVMLGLGALALLAGIAAGSFITHGLLKQLGAEPDYTANIAGHIANGDLCGRIDTKPGDKDSLLAEIKIMRDSLVKIVTQVRSGTDMIAAVSHEIAVGNEELHQHTDSATGELERTASSMEELTSTVKANADNAREANLMAANASAVARKGGDVVAQVVNTMGAINESSRRIVDIISVIDGIAFQTNILALNAAVEAARAGEQGRGFAVVASEVRSLAQRSAAAAKEIKTLIGDSVEEVRQGSLLVEEAGTTMTEVVASVKRVTDIMSEIADASREQSAGIEQINHAIIEMDSMTQQNAMLVQKAGDAAQSLQDQAAQLANVVRLFKLEPGQALALR